MVTVIEKNRIMNKDKDKLNNNTIDKDKILENEIKDFDELQKK